MRGSCKWWNSTRGYGFVTGEDGQDYFLHYSEIEGTGRKDVAPNDFIDFEPSKNSKGLKAIKAKVAATQN